MCCELLFTDTNVTPDSRKRYQWVRDGMPATVTIVNTHNHAIVNADALYMRKIDPLILFVFLLTLSRHLSCEWLCLFLNWCLFVKAYLHYRTIYCSAKMIWTILFTLIAQTKFNFLEQHCYYHLTAHCFIAFFVLILFCTLCTN